MWGCSGACAKAKMPADAHARQAAWPRDGLVLSVRRTLAVGTAKASAPVGRPVSLRKHCTEALAVRPHGTHHPGGASARPSRACKAQPANLLRGHGVHEPLPAVAAHCGGGIAGYAGWLAGLGGGGRGRWHGA